MTETITKSDSNIKMISVVTPCFNEEENVELVYEQVKRIFETLKKYRYEHIFIDNASTDKTVTILRSLAQKDKNVKVILNVRNFGHIRSPYYGLIQSQGDASVLLAADLQDPPVLIVNFIRKWEEGYKVVLGIKTDSEESRAMFTIRRAYYKLITAIAETKLVKNNTGFGLYDKCVIKILRQIDEPYPYLRGLISEIGFESAMIEYTQPKRIRGISKNNFYTLYDIAMLGITNHSKVPLRLATFIGLGVACLSLLIAIGYLVAKLIFWNYFSIGIAPLIFGIFFFASVQLFFLGILGEYIGNIYTQILKRPLVIEKERLNF
jgi:glycosyltransferase involved in cell wall biosynthesis